MLLDAGVVISLSISVSLGGDVAKIRMYFASSSNKLKEKETESELLASSAVSSRNAMR